MSGMGQLSVIDKFIVLSAQAAEWLVHQLLKGLLQGTAFGITPAWVALKLRYTFVSLLGHECYLRRYSRWFLLEKKSILFETSI